MIRSKSFEHTDLFLLTTDMNSWYKDNPSITVISVSHSSVVMQNHQVEQSSFTSSSIIKYSAIVTYSSK